MHAHQEPVHLRNDRQPGALAAHRQASTVSAGAGTTVTGTRTPQSGQNTAVATNSA